MQVPIETNKPVFIAIDGIDGCGKTTIAKYLCRKLNAVYLSAVGSSPIGAAIRAEIIKPERKYDDLLMFNFLLSANLTTIYDCVLPALKSGRSVVCDRFISSLFAYQVSRLADPNIDAIYEKYFDKLLVDVKPDLFVWCNVDVEIANTRISARHQHLSHFDTESIALKKDLVKSFQSFYALYPEKKLMLNANQDLDIVLKEMDSFTAIY